MAELTENQYGKTRVRVFRVDRSNEQHQVFEVSTDVLLRGDFQATYVSGDNSKVVPTDTMKNTVYYMAKSSLNAEKSIESFGISLCKHFLVEYKQVSEVTVDMKQTTWERVIDPKTGQPHNISFVKRPELRLATVWMNRKGQLTVKAGITDLILMKTTDSAFTGFHKCKLTTLPEAKDRLFCSSVKARWTYNTQQVQKGAINYDKIFSGVRDVIVDKFANEWSNSVQQVVHLCGQTAMAKYNEVEEIHVAMPNIHIISFDIARFGLQNKDEVYYPTDEPSGYLEAVYRRPRSKL
jgi:urate oxidase